MRTFVDIRFYVDPESSMTAEHIANAIARGRRYSDLTPVKIKSYRLVDFGAEADDGEIVRWNDPKERNH